MNFREWVWNASWNRRSGYGRAGRRNVCVNRRASYGHQGLDGSHTEYMRVEKECLIRLPDHLSFLDGARQKLALSRPFSA